MTRRPTRLGALVGELQRFAQAGRAFERIGQRLHDDAGVEESDSPLGVIDMVEVAPGVYQAPAPRPRRVRPRNLFEQLERFEQVSDELEHELGLLFGRRR